MMRAAPGKYATACTFGRVASRAVVSTCLMLAIVPLSAQLFSEDHTGKYDTTYIRVYRDELTTRMFLSRRQNGYFLPERLFSPWIRYKTNDQLLFGVGYTYSFLTLNLSLKLPFLNGDDEQYGESRILDLQTHNIFRNMIVDLYLQWNRGFYLADPPDPLGSPGSGNGYPVRGDLRTTLVGINIQRLFNSERYSYKASFVQNEIQKRSAGSPLLGVEAYWMLGMADSLIIPGYLQQREFAHGGDFNQADLFNLGLNGGYAYTLVIRRRFYISLSTVIGLAAGSCVLNYTATSDLTSSGLTGGINNHNRVSMGYNKNDFYIGVSWVQFNMGNTCGYRKGWFRYSSGNIRINVVRRFRLHRSIKVLRPDLWVF
jgi:hypothetical protein